MPKNNAEAQPEAQPEEQPEEPPTEPAYSPVAPGPDKAKWRPVVFADTLCVQGGYLAAKRVCCVENQSVVATVKSQGALVERTTTYVKISKNDEWLIKACAGDAAQRGALRRSKCIEQIRDLMKNDSPTKAASAVADLQSPGNASAVADPMDSLEEVADDDGAQPSASNSRYKRQRRKRAELIVIMPDRAPCAFPKDKAKAKDVHVMADSTNQVWLAKEDVPWLLTYIADECGFGGVDAEVESAVAEPNCPQVPGLNVEWDWTSNDGYTAQFVVGPLAGDQRYNVLVSTFTAEKWSAANDIHKYQKSFGEADNDDLKKATYDYLVMQCAKMLKEREEATR